MPILYDAPEDSLNKSGSGAGVANWYRLQIRSTDPPGTIYNLPAKSFVTHIIVNSETVKNFAINADNSVPADLVTLVPDQLYDPNHIARVETFAPAIYVEPATKIVLEGAADTLTNVDIFYTDTTI